MTNYDFWFDKNMQILFNNLNETFSLTTKSLPPVQIIQENETMENVTSLCLFHILYD